MMPRPPYMGSPMPPMGGGGMGAPMPPMGGGKPPGYPLGGPPGLVGGPGVPTFSYTPQGDVVVVQDLGPVYPDGNGGYAGSGYPNTGSGYNQIPGQYPGPNYPMPAYPMFRENEQPVEVTQPVFVRGVSAEDAASP